MSTKVSTNKDVVAYYDDKEVGFSLSEREFFILYEALQVVPYKQLRHISFGDGHEIITSVEEIQRVIRKMNWALNKLVKLE